MKYFLASIPYLYFKALLKQKRAEESMLAVRLQDSMPSQLQIHQHSARTLWVNACVFYGVVFIWCLTCSWVTRWNHEICLKLLILLVLGIFCYGHCRSSSFKTSHWNFLLGIKHEDNIEKTSELTCPASGWAFKSRITNMICNT